MTPISKFGVRTAQVYMRVAKHWALIAAWQQADTQSTASLTIAAADRYLARQLNPEGSRRKRTPKQPPEGVEAETPDGDSVPTGDDGPQAALPAPETPTDPDSSPAPAAPEATGRPGTEPDNAGTTDRPETGSDPQTTAELVMGYLQTEAMRTKLARFLDEALTYDPVEYERQADREGREVGQVLLDRLYEVLQHELTRM